MLEEKYTILYLINPDPIFYGEMDQKIIEAFEKTDNLVIQADLNALSFTLEDNISFYQSGVPIQFDAFLAYGYMSPKHYQDYYYFNMAVQSAGKVTLHSHNTEHILQNKLLQYIKFSENQVTIPKTGAAFSNKSFTDLTRQFKEKAVMKEVTGYAGTGVELTKNKAQSISIYSKSLWKEEQMLIQNFIEDSIGRSIRVLVIGGKPISATEFQDSTDFKSNGYSNDFSIVSKMDSPQKELYFNLALRACQAIDENLTIGGVDILDSKDKGLQVLEINSWPEIFDSQECTKLPLLDTFIEEFIRKIATNKFHKDL